MTADYNYVIREARADDISALVTLLEQHFFPCEYFNKGYFERNKHKIDDIEKENIELDVKERYTVMVANLPCLVAVQNESKRIVGISIMVVEENPKFAKLPSSDVDNYAAKMSSITWRSKLFADFLTYVLGPADTPGDLFVNFPSHRKALEISNLCVIPEHCGRGLATRLVQESIRYAGNKGFGLIYGLFSSPFSQKAADKNDFKKFNEFDVLNLRDRNNDVIFQGTEPQSFRLDKFMCDPRTFRSLFSYKPNREKYQNNGCGSIYGLFTPPASEKASEENDFEKVNNIDTRSICDSNGTRIYQNEEFHIISIMGKELQIASDSNTSGKGSIRKS